MARATKTSRQIRATVTRASAELQDAHAGREVEFARDEVQLLQLRRLEPARLRVTLGSIVESPTRRAACE